MPPRARAHHQSKFPPRRSPSATSDESNPRQAVAGDAPPSISGLIYINPKAGQVDRDVRKTLCIRGIAPHVDDDYLLAVLRRFGTLVLVSRRHWLQEVNADGIPRYDMAWIEFSTREEAILCYNEETIFPGYHEDEHEHRAGSQGTGGCRARWIVDRSVNKVRYPRDDERAQAVRLVSNSSVVSEPDLQPHKRKSGRATPVPEKDRDSTITQEGRDGPTTPVTEKRLLAPPGTTPHRTAPAPRVLPSYGDAYNERVRIALAGTEPSVQGALTPSRVLQFDQTASESTSNASVTVPPVEQNQLPFVQDFAYLLSGANLRCRKYCEAVTIAASHLFRDQIDNHQDQSQPSSHDLLKMFIELRGHARSVQDCSQLLVLNAAFFTFCKSRSQLLYVSNRAETILRTDNGSTESVLNDALNIALLLAGVLPTAADRLFELVKELTYPRKPDSSFLVEANSITELGIPSDRLPELIMFGLGPIPVLETTE